MEFHFRQYFRLRPKMKNAYRSASNIHHKKVLILVLILRCKALIGLRLEIKVLFLILMLKKVLIRCASGCVVECRICNQELRVRISACAT